MNTFTHSLENCTHGNTCHNHLVMLPKRGIASQNLYSLVEIWFVRAIVSRHSKLWPYFSNCFCWSHVFHRFDFLEINADTVVGNMVELNLGSWIFLARSHISRLAFRRRSPNTSSRSWMCSSRVLLGIIMSPKNCNIRSCVVQTLFHQIL